MTTLAANLKRVYELGEDPVLNDVPMVAADIVYEGSAVGDAGGAGTARPLVAADVFLGFAIAKADNASGAASAINCRIAQKGTIKLAITGVTGTTDVGSDVYADDDNDFTLTSSSNSSIGTISRWVSSTTAMVRFEGAAMRSI